MCLTEHYGLSREIQWTSWSVGTESSSSVAMQYSHPATRWRSSVWTFLQGWAVAAHPKTNKNKKTLYQRKSSSANNHLCIFFLLLFFWNDACVLKCRPRSLICVAKSQFYIQRFQIPEGHLQRQVQPPCDHPISGEAQGRKGFFIRAKKGGIVPISSGKRATVGINRSVLGN